MLRIGPLRRLPVSVPAALALLASAAPAPAQLATSETQVTMGPGEDQRPAWSPDGATILFDTNRQGNLDIFSVPAGGGTEAQLTISAQVDRHPEWSPDGLSFAFAANPAGGSTDLYTRGIGAGPPVVVDADPANNDGFPSWSPDGTTLAFRKTTDIYLIPATGGVPVQLTTNPAVDSHPSWSPDGTKIAFQSDRSGNNDIWVAEVVGGARTQITFDPGADGSPDWSPDGQFITFHSDRSGTNDIWMVPAGGGAAVQVTTGPGDDLQPDWAPDGSAIAFARDGKIWTATLPTAQLSVSKSVDDPAPAEGGTVVYTVIVTNAGPDDATNVSVTDVLPAGVTFVGSGATSGLYNAGTGVWSLAGVTASSSQTLQITASVDAGTGGTTITNTAAVTETDQVDTNSGDDSASADITVQSSVVDAPVLGGGPAAFALQAPRPNPFRAGTALEFDVPVAGVVDLSIHDAAGRLVKTMVSGEAAAGRHHSTWDGRDNAGRLVSPGVYFVRLQAEGFRMTRKAVRLD